MMGKKKMKARYQSLELVEKIVLQTHHNVWAAFSIRGCGILTRAMIGKHDGDHMETRRTALAFAYQVVRAIGLCFGDERVPTPQILIDAADVAIEDTKRAGLMCTTWQYLPEGVEICSVGSNTVLIYEENTIRKAIAPHTIHELLQSQGIQIQEYESKGGLVTHMLGSQKNSKSCRVDDVRVALVPLLPTTTIAIIANWRLAEDILRYAVPRNELSSFIESWDVFAVKQRTSVLISLAEH
jgi:hypothetical protein